MQGFGPHEPGTASPGPGRLGRKYLQTSPSPELRGPGGWPVYTIDFLRRSIHMAKVVGVMPREQAKVWAFVTNA
jgi:hypothetical protein